MNGFRKNKLLRLKDMQIIFSNLEDIYNTNQTFANSLDERISAKFVQKVGDLFVNVSEHLQLYTMYCRNHPYSLIKLETIRNNKSIAKFLDVSLMV